MARSTRHRRKDGHG